ncbi:SU10 major capsid protein [Nocardiopsis protaetiae]|uniref:SU10 major capsid protein n=1 Tax=Nocardiopsis protaetiae TaxID=3382270 RepID=UPI00387B3280
MPGITGQGTTFNLPNYVGELFAVSPETTPFLSAIGGLTGGRPANSTHFTWQGYDLRDAATDRQRLEGANAPEASGRARFSVMNVCEIHQETVETSYTKQAASGQFGDIGANHPNVDGINGTNPVMDEHGWQVAQVLKQIARDVEATFLAGTFNDPASNAAPSPGPRRTRGLIQAIDTNAEDASGADLDEDMILDLMQTVWTAGGINEAETATIIANAYQKRQLTRIFITEKNYQEQTRNVGGVNLQTIETDFGRLNIMLNRYMPTDTVVVASLEQCAPRFLPVPNKGFLFQEELAKTGASERTQIYGEIGLEYGNELAHGKITGLADSAGS